MNPSDRAIQTRNYILQAIEKEKADKMFTGWLRNEIEILLLRLILDTNLEMMERFKK